MLCKLITQSWSISSSCLAWYEKNLGWTQKVKLLENKECKGKELFSTQLKIWFISYKMVGPR